MKTNNVLVNNLCSWPLSFRRMAGQGDIEIPGNARNFPLLSEEEVLAQIQTGNVMFTGTDNMGSHARIQIVDEEKRKELFGLGDIETSAPILLNEERSFEESVKELLAIRTKTKFNEQLNAMVKTDAEKRMLVELAFNAGAENAESWKVDALRKLAETAKI